MEGRRSRRSRVEEVECLPLEGRSRKVYLEGRGEEVEEVECLPRGEGRRSRRSRVSTSRGGEKK